MKVNKVVNLLEITMIGKIIEAIVIIGILVFSGLYLYENMPGDPITLRLNPSANNLSILTEDFYGEYPNTPVFSEYLRFDHTNISYAISRSCSSSRKDSMVEAFDIFEGLTDFITFHEVFNQTPDIIVTCSSRSEELGDNFFAAGEGGPSKITNTTFYNVIEQGKISLYKQTECSSPVVEIHELGHVFGFDHTPNKKSIMYNVSSCDQKITPDMIKIINELYSIEPLPDVRISSLEATTKGRYLDFNVTVLNEGLKDFENLTLTVVVDGKVIKEFVMGAVNIGYGRSLQVTNIRLTSRSVKKIDFFIDYNNNVQELDELDNHFEMVL